MDRGSVFIRFRGIQGIMFPSFLFTFAIRIFHTSILYCVLNLVLYFVILGWNYISAHEINNINGSKLSLPLTTHPNLTEPSHMSSAMLQLRYTRISEQYASPVQNRPA